MCLNCFKNFIIINASFTEDDTYECFISVPKNLEKTMKDALNESDLMIEMLQGSISGTKQYWQVQFNCTVEKFEGVLNIMNKLKIADYLNRDYVKN